MRFIQVLCGMLVAAVLVGCGPAVNPVADQATAQPDIQATIDAAVAATQARLAEPTPTTETNRTTDTTATNAPATTQATSVAARNNDQFQIDKRARSDQGALENVELLVRSARVANNQLTLRIAFQNISNEGFQLFGGFSGTDIRLADAAGTEYEPEEISDNLRLNISPEDGFAPGAANVGDITFALPTGSEPYELRVPTYEPVLFRLDTPLVADAADAPQPGSYPVNISVRSAEDALRQIELRVREVEFGNDEVIFDVAFVNVGRQGYDLLIGPRGTDARLLDAEGTQYEPSKVDQTFDTSIAPEDGWQPGQEHSGTISFPMPAAPQTLRFVFPQYDAVSLTLDANGIAEAQVTSALGGAPQPTPTPDAEETAFAEVEALLREQAEALRGGNEADYLATFDPALHPEQRAILARVGQLPIISLTVELAPDADLDDAAQGSLDAVGVELRYAFDGIDADNPFAHQLNYSLQRNGNEWLVSAVEVEENPPFWQNGDVVLRQTPHFLIFARPEAQNELDALEQESEAAYARLQARGLPLDARYVTYFTSSRSDFEDLTGATSQLILGMALSRYQFVGDAITTTSRAFYINGEAFVDERMVTQPDARQTTIAHELTHLVLGRDTRPFTPIWLVEGAAVYYSEELGDDKRQLLRDSERLEAISLDTLTGQSSLGEHDFTGEQAGAEYLYSGFTFAHLVATYGEERTLAFYRSFAEVPAADVREQMPAFGGAFLAEAAFGQLSRELTDEAVQRFFNTSLLELDAAVKQSLQ